jgi:16S rRNA processing protein RimM
MKHKKFEPSALYEIGYLKKTNGINGEIILVPNTGITESNIDVDFLFFDIEGLPVPFMVEKLHWRGDDSVSVKFKYIDSKEKAQEYIACNVFSENKNDFSEDNFNPHILKGFSLHNQEGKKIGIVEIINDFGGSLVLSVFSGKKELLVPFHNELLISLDPKEKKVILEIAEGLFDE